MTEDDTPALERVYGSFFRYRSFANSEATEKRQDEERKRLTAMFNEEVFWFSKPSALNDPFDCKPAFLWSPDESENRQHVKAAWIECYTEVHGRLPTDGDEISAHVSEVMSAFETQESRNRAYWDAADKRTGVLCVSKRWDIVQQWTYYARDHSGFCIELYVDHKSTLSAFEINYTENRPVIELHQLYAGSKKLTVDTILTKASAWSHEDEVRILNHHSGNIKIPEGVIRSVTFGLNASDDDIDWLQSVCSETELELNFYRCVMDDTAYTLRRDSLD